MLLVHGRMRAPEKRGRFPKKLFLQNPHAEGSGRGFDLSVSPCAVATASVTASSVSLQLQTWGLVDHDLLSWLPRRLGGLVGTPGEKSVDCYGLKKLQGDGSDSELFFWSSLHHQQNKMRLIQELILEHAFIILHPRGSTMASSSRTGRSPFVLGPFLSQDTLLPPL